MAVCLLITICDQMPLVVQRMHGSNQCRHGAVGRSEQRQHEYVAAQITGLGASATTGRLASAISSVLSRQSEITYKETKYDRATNTHDPNTAFPQCITLPGPWEVCTMLVSACLLQSMLQKLNDLTILLPLERRSC
jgi:hypothetical protein